jgi:hypothetical protein
VASHSARADPPGTALTCDTRSTFPLDVTVSRVSAATRSSAGRARVEQVAVSGIVPEASQYEPDDVVRVALPGQESLALEGVDEARVVEVGSPAERARPEAGRPWAVRRLRGGSPWPVDRLVELQWA